MLKATFIELADEYSCNNDLSKELWNEIEVSYSGKNRHYHTALHIDNLLKELTAVRSQISEWNTMLFSLFYHDVIYNPARKNNEEKSALLAEKRMASISVPKEIIEKCKEQIIATKTHILNSDKDTNIFTDADLSILGKDWDAYLKYCQQIRKEYAVYPDFIYTPGRKKVLSHFLQMDRIFKTDYFFEKFEFKARQNLQREFDEL